MRGLGDNGGPPLEERPKSIRRRWAMLIFSHPDKPVGAVAMAFKLYTEMNAAGEGAAISDQDFAEACGISDRAVRTFKNWLVKEGFIAIQARGNRGRASTFKAVVPDEIPAPRSGIPEQNTGTDCRKSDNGLPEMDAGIPELPEPHAGNRQIPAQDAGSSPRVRARIELPSEVLIPNSLNTPPQPPQGGADTVLKDGEVLLGHRVVVNCQTIRHLDGHFALSIPAVECRTLGIMPRDEIKQKLTGFALQWGLEIEQGRDPRKVVPNNPLNWVCASLQGDQTRAAVAGVRKDQARRPAKATPLPEGKSFMQHTADVLEKIMAEEAAKGGRR